MHGRIALFITLFSLPAATQADTLTLCGELEMAPTNSKIAVAAATQLGFQYEPLAVDCLATVLEDKRFGSWFVDYADQRQMVRSLTSLYLYEKNSGKDLGALTALYLGLETENLRANFYAYEMMDRMNIGNYLSVFDQAFRNLSDSKRSALELLMSYIWSYDLLSDPDPFYKWIHDVHRRYVLGRG